MIDATEAKRLYDETGREIEDFLDFTVEKEIINAAKAGKRLVFIYLDNINTFVSLDRLTTPFQKNVVLKLQELGYTARIDLYGKEYVPKGLQDDLGNGPVHSNYGIIIEW